MKLLLLTLFALALWAPSSTAARKNLKSPVRHLKAPAFSALNETELQRKHLTASELIRRKGVLEGKLRLRGEGEGWCVGVNLIKEGLQKVLG